MPAQCANAASISRSFASGVRKPECADTLTFASVVSKWLAASSSIANREVAGQLLVGVQAVLAHEPQIIAWSEEFASKENALFLGRGMHYPVALEGALKLKEISYILRAAGIHDRQLDRMAA
jgi:glucosamine 6-phosphate synthetase-like amidotransferase/phosphosugar isomerase protein